MRMDDLKDALVYPEGMIFGSILSLAVAPLLMIPIASIFTKNPQLYTGLLLASIVPPGGMITYWTGILGANYHLTLRRFLRSQGMIYKAFNNLRKVS